ncbi:hypothetical protein R3P38DRAFT_3195930 [Favolaschia claudopus]|uniref:Uncharacterized protein n=1 Tax=Favolaschia claudopus TaxID=2862362 RepID=A0AAW0BA94_9AGAR
MTAATSEGDVKPDVTSPKIRITVQFNGTQTLRFNYDGTNIRDEDTADDLEMDDEDAVIDGQIFQVWITIMHRAIGNSNLVIIFRKAGAYVSKGIFSATFDQSCNLSGAESGNLDLLLLEGLCRPCGLFDHFSLKTDSLEPLRYNSRLLGHPIVSSPNSQNTAIAFHKLIDGRRTFPTQAYRKLLAPCGTVCTLADLAVMFER